MRGSRASSPSNRGAPARLGALAEQTRSWDATETASRIAKGEISPVEAVKAAIERAEAAEPVIGAIAYRRFEEALSEAAEPKTGFFAGVPTFIKDMEELRGAPTGFGSVALPKKAAARTAPSVAQFLSTGVVPLGKSTTAEFGLTATTEPVHGVPTCNPRDPSRSAGGSSGGAAALVAAGVVPVAHGGDGGGSIRIPAAFCGLVGMKASRGRLVPMESTRRMPVKISTYGVLSRSVRDTARYFAAVAPQARGKMPPVGEVEGPSRTRWRIGLFIEPLAKTAVDPEVRSATLRAARALEDEGHAVDEIPAPHGRGLIDDFVLYWGFLAASVETAVRSTPGGDPEKLEPWTRDLARRARRSWIRIPGAMWRLQRFATIYARVFDRCDVILSPTTAAPAPKLGHLGGRQSYEQHLSRLLELVPYTPIQNASGGPAISLPVARTESGLPIGVQLAAPWGEERRLLELGCLLEPSFDRPIASATRDDGVARTGRPALES